MSCMRRWGFLKLRVGVIFPLLDTPRSVILRKAPRLDAKPRHHRPCNLRGVTPEHPKATSWHLNSSLCRRLEQTDLPVSYTTTTTQTNVHSKTTPFFTDDRHSSRHPRHSPDYTALPKLHPNSSRQCTAGPVACLPTTRRPSPLARRGSRGM